MWPFKKKAIDKDLLELLALQREYNHEVRIQIGKLYDHVIQLRKDLDSILGLL